MKANQLIQQLVRKLFGEKVKTPAPSQHSAGEATVVGIKPVTKVPGAAFDVHVGTWQLHEHWRN